MTLVIFLRIYAKIFREERAGELFAPHRVILIGYKYGDDHINEILFKTLENPNNIFYFFLYNPDEQGEFIDQLKRLSDSMPNINILTGKVLADYKTFVKYILPATPEKTDQEKAIELLQKVLVGHAGK